MEENVKNIAQGITTEELKDTLNKIVEMIKPEKVTLSIKETAEYTGIGEHKIREITEKLDTDFPFFKVGTKTLINKELLDKWIIKITNENRVL